jgi:GDPmannose 4,6-dehydratase
VDSLKRALITGVTGQDGSYLAHFLLKKGYKVFGTFRRLSTPNFWRLQCLGVYNQINLIPVDLSDMSSLLEAVTIAKPDEIYHLAAQSYVGASFDQPLATCDITGAGVTRMLEILRNLTNEGILDRRRIRFYQASTSELYGNGNYNPRNEDTLFQPQSPYAAAKLYGHWMTRLYREAYGLFACTGILFNHESPLRGLEFVTRKISNGAAKIKLGIQRQLSLGNLEATRDWGYAPEYVEAMWLMLQSEEPDDFVIATGVGHTVREFAKAVFAELDLDYSSHVTIDRKFLRPLDVSSLIGNSDKARQKLGWKPLTNFESLARIMITADLQNWKRWLAGEKFPWDAPNYPDEAQLITRSLAS